MTCRTRAEAEHALVRAGRTLERLGVTLNREKTRIVHIAHGFEFLGFKIQRGKARYKLTRDRIKSKLNRQNLYAIPTQKSVDQFKDQIRVLTRRRILLRLDELIETINPIIRGWGNYYCRSHVRKRFHQLDGWIIRRLWSHRTKRLAERSLEEISHQTAAHRVQAGRAGLTDTFASGRESPFMKAGCGKTARAKGNVSQQSTGRAQYRGPVSQALERIRQAARQRKKEKFTTLLHHVSTDHFERGIL